MRNTNGTLWICCKKSRFNFYKCINAQEEVYEFEKEKERKAKEHEERYNNLKREVSNWSREELENYVINTMLEDYDAEYDEDDGFIGEYY